MSLPRRHFVLGLAGLLPLPLVARRFHARAVADLDPRVLRALAAAVLPGELGGPGLERTVTAFESWLAGYREGAELVHGYGTAELRVTGPSPALRWSNQLRELAAAAAKAPGTGFDRLSIAERQAMVRAALEGQRLGGLPQVDRAPHLALGLLAFFYDSPEATDLCYEVNIGRNACRPLAGSERQPLPLARGP